MAEVASVPNVVSEIILCNRLYDTIFEVVVFTIAILGAQYLLANELRSTQIRQFEDPTAILLARLGAMIAALVGIELAIRGHLSPIGLSIVTLAGWELPHGELGALFSGGMLPVLNILVAIQVALGSWAAVLVFIRCRGLL